MDVRMIELSACAVVAVAIVARIFWLFTNRVPVLARSENVDALGESLPGDPLNPAEVPQGLGRMSPFHTADMRVEYELGGKRYEHDVETHSIDGLDVTGPDDMPILWADPKNPARVAAHGPGFWFLALLVVGLCAALVSEFAA
jgi:hypothetical protein